MSKPCPSCHLCNRDVAVFCRGCAKRFPARAKAEPVPVIGAEATAAAATAMPSPPAHGALRAVPSILVARRPRHALAIELPNLMLAAVVAVCAFMLWFMGHEAARLHAAPMPGSAAAAVGRSAGNLVAHDARRLREATTVAEARAGE